MPPNAQTEGLQLWDDDDGSKLSADEGPLRVALQRLAYWPDLVNVNHIYMG